MTLIFWQNIISQLQVPFIISIKKLYPDFEITYIAEIDVNESRKKLGWISLKGALTDNGVNCLISPSSKEVINLFESTEHLQTHHFFSGLTSYHLVKNAFQVSLKFQNVNRYLIAEGPFLYKRPKLLHYFKAYFLEKRYYKYVKLVFTIGKNSSEWYESLGFDKAQIIPFCYIVQQPYFNNDKSLTKPKIPTFTFVGNLIHRKGVDIAIKAFSAVTLPFKFKIIGDGDERSSLENLVKSLDLSDDIDFLGVQQSNDIYNYLMVSDFLILPSRHDGWGAVINEGLMCGNYIISSDASGAQELLYEGFNGSVFDIKSKESLILILNESLGNINNIRQNSSKIIAWSDKIGADIIAKYFVNSLNEIFDQRQVPPWRKIEH